MSALDQPQFVASNTEVSKHGAIGDMGSPMQEDEDLSVELDLEQKLAETETLTPDELAKIGADLTERMTDFNRELYPEGYARCKELYRFARQHITALIADMPLDPEEDKARWERKAKLFLLGAEEVHEWLDAEDGLDDSAWIDDDDMEEEESKDVKNGKSDQTTKPDQTSKPVETSESSPDKKE
ncbi:hypothetical protein QFC22_002707 [Naganishia vaughanmartiniae]|uniref:Uncharacterized protein n=1 Tax=Naganishia vaughanmartiniae TaxID=1424756 RepID=A0ACC2X9S0_9TREE|nr:hypothetical protein QFC22_002707 [Naganishia vaughanmartiniae]